MGQNQKAEKKDENYKKITLKTSDGETIQGHVYLRANTRVSDLFTRSESPFVVVVNALLRSGQDKILIINKDHILWVEPED
jgi:hypothetical protein